MGFFDNTKNVGWAIVGAALLMILSGILSIVDGYGGDHFAGFAIAGIGAIIASFFYLKFGNGVRTGARTDKMDIVGTFVKVVGYAVIVTGLFGSVGGLLGSGDAVSSLIYVICGIIVLWVSSKMMDDKATTFDKIVWIVLLAVFLILFLSSFIGIFTNGFDVIVILTCLCKAIIYLIMFIFLFDVDVKKKMGM